MNNKLLIPVVIVGAVVVGYFLGVSNKSTNTQADTSAKKTVMPQSDEGGSINSVIPGAQHIHAVTYDPEGNLLLGTHGGFILLPLKLRPPLRHGPAWTKEVAMVTEAADPIERWTAKRRVTLVISILKGETSVAEAARTHGLTVA